LRADVRRRAGAFRAGFAVPDVLAAPVERFAAVERLATGFFAPLERLPVERLAVERFAAGLRAPDERAPPVARAAPPELEPPPSASVHLPAITRCAASATASAISEPNLVALAIMLLAAWDAVSAASSPASRILRRAAGLALIAAAAAARPAASISLLIAALASLSTVLSPELEDDLEELLFADFAIASISLGNAEALYSRNGSRMKPEMREIPDMLKGTAANAAMPFDMVSGRK
jgi:hypothetical protein